MFPYRYFLPVAEIEIMMYKLGGLCSALRVFKNLLALVLYKCYMENIVVGENTIAVVHSYLHTTVSCPRREH